jgi:hypothetical protein
LALAVPLSRFTSRVGGGSAFYVRHRPHFMRIPHIIITAALTAVFVVGCSKSPSKPLSHLPPNSKDLGVIEFTEGTPYNFSLGDGKGITGTAKRHPKYMEVSFSVETTNEDGTVTEKSGPKLAILLNQEFVYAIGDTGFRFTPKWKTP